ADAYIRYTSSTAGSVQAGGDVAIEAIDTAGINSNSVVLQSAVSANTLEGVVDVVNAFIPKDYQFTTASGTRELLPLAKVRVGSSYDSTTGMRGAVYR